MVSVELFSPKTNHLLPSSAQPPLNYIEWLYIHTYVMYIVQCVLRYAHSYLIYNIENCLIYLTLIYVNSYWPFISLKFTFCFYFKSQIYPLAALLLGRSIQGSLGWAESHILALLEFETLICPGILNTNSKSSGCLL